MNKKMTWMVLPLILILATMISCVGHRGHGLKNGQIHDFLLFKLKKELKLTDSQMDSLKKIITEVEEKIHSMHTDAEMEVKHAEIKALILSESLYPQDILDFVSKNSEKHEELKLFIATKISEVHGILTQKQKEKLIQHLEQLCEKKHTQARCFH